MIHARELSIIVVSDGDPKRAAERLSRLAPDAEIVHACCSPEEAAREHTFNARARAINRAWTAARGEHLLLVGADVLVTRAALDVMRACLDDPAVGAVGPTLIDERGARVRSFGLFHWADWVPARGVAQVPLLSIACLLTRRDVHRDVGALNDRFVLPNESRDWCTRAARRGFRLERVPERVVCARAGVERARLAVELHRGVLDLARSWQASSLDAVGSQTGSSQTGSSQTGSPQTGSSQTGSWQTGSSQTGAQQLPAPTGGVPESVASGHTACPRLTPRGRSVSAAGGGRAPGRL